MKIVLQWQWALAFGSDICKDLGQECLGLVVVEMFGQVLGRSRRDVVDGCQC